MTRSARRLLIPAVYPALVLIPIVVAVAPPRPPGRGFWIEFSLALGFIALAQLAIQFGLIARFERISRPFGIDLVMQYHRQIGMLILLFVVAHVVILLVEQPAYRAMLNPAGSSWAARTGVIATAGSLALAGLSLWRKQLHIGYEVWRVTHALLAIVTIGSAQLHVSLAGLYVNRPWKHGALTLWCLFFVCLIIYLRLIKPLQMANRPWRVVEVRPEAAETWSVAIEPVGHPGCRFAPGQFAWLKVGPSPWNVAEHPFSYSSSAERADRVEFGIKELGDFTSTIGQVPIGTPAFIDGPHGSFTIDDQPAESYLFIAGGIGISPILSMLRTLADRKDRRPHALLYACSEWDRVAFRDDVAALAGELDLKVVYVLEKPPKNWEGPAGFIDRKVLEPFVGTGAAGEMHVFLCGPDAMLSAVERELKASGVRDDHIHMERFNLV